MNKHKGFTIIEVVLVLAIAGLIFLMVFIALPALQRSQRNTSYKNNVATFLSLLQNYKTNNRGQLPPNTDNYGFQGGTEYNSEHPFYKYFTESGLADQASSVKIERTNTYGWRTGSATGRDRGRLFAITDGKCQQPSSPFAVGVLIATRQPGSVAVWTVLEEGADGMIYCQDS